MTMVDPGTETDEGESEVVRRVLLVWDAPNLDMGLGAILGVAHRRAPPAVRRAGTLAAGQDR